jgi:hypothetical protein
VREDPDRREYQTEWAERIVISVFIFGGEFSLTWDLGEACRILFTGVIFLHGSAFITDLDQLRGTGHWL